MLGFYCRLLMIDVASTYGVFEGPQDKLLFTYDLSALEDGKYRTAEMLIACSVLHNGPGIRALHPALFQIMCTQKADLQHFDHHDIPNEKVQNNLQKVQQCVTEEQFMSLCSELGDWISDCGVLRIFTAKIKDISSIFDHVVKYYIYFRTASVIHQFIEGMNICGNLWSQVERNWVAFLPIFTNTCHCLRLRASIKSPGPHKESTREGGRKKPCLDGKCSSSQSRKRLQM
ncbi:uncharacterized protein LOC121681465 [Alosa sapidissima]|uniref:uncharacterized protein LOC121681465 n=1 Tax=Alosa sapidissima TaxID=34773 RepID=UPI001C08C21E|nr:uncharacterized protein LOC121681465 [Alosa sapidissima]